MDGWMMNDSSLRSRSLQNGRRAGSQKDQTKGVGEGWRAIPQVSMKGARAKEKGRGLERANPIQSRWMTHTRVDELI